MYIPKHYAVTDISKMCEFIKNNNFGILFSHTGSEPMASHLPFVIDEVGDQGLILGHMAKANRQWRYADGQQVLVVFHGPHAYVSPTWYQEDEVVPTWNYVTVHAYGKPVVIDNPEKVREGQTRLVGVYESDATGNWSMDDMPEDYASKMLNGIVSFEMPIDRLEGKFKLNQKNSLADRKGAIKGLQATGDPEAREVARLMGEILADD